MTTLHFAHQLTSNETAWSFSCQIRLTFRSAQYMYFFISLSIWLQFFPCQESHTSVGGCAEKKVNILLCSWAHHHWETWPETHCSVCKLSVTGTQINKEAYCMWLERERISEIKPRAPHYEYCNFTSQIQVKSRQYKHKSVHLSTAFCFYFSSKQSFLGGAIKIPVQVLLLLGCGALDQSSRTPKFLIVAENSLDML